MAVAMQYGNGRNGLLNVGMSMTLLWTNVDDESAFAAQTLSLSLGGYDAVLIKFKLTASGSIYANTIGFVGEQTTLYSSNASTTSYTYKRYATISTSDITFTTGYRNTTSGTSYAVPCEIYGIKRGGTSGGSSSSGSGGGGGGTGTLTQVTFDGTVYTDDGTGNVTLAESDPIFVASDAYTITSTDISNWNAKPDSLSGFGITATASEINTLDGITASTVELNYTDGVTSNIQDQLDTKAPIITETVTGAIVNFPDGADDIPVQDLVVNIEPVQSGSGNPSPSNIRPITGWTGANVTRCGTNVCEEDFEDGYITTSGGLSSYQNAIRSKNYNSCVPNAQYYYKITQGIGGANIAWYDAQKTFIQRDNNKANAVITAPSNARFFKLSIYNYKATNPTYANDISINCPSTDHDYHAYITPATYSIDWTTEAGTVYGGSLDVTTGVLTVDRAIVDMGNINWSKSSTSSSVGGSVFAMPISSFDPPMALRARYTENTMLCDLFKTCSANIWFVNTMADYEVMSNETSIYLSASDYETASAFQTAMVGRQLCYKLATPQTYQLTPQQLMTLLGTNNVWADTGNVSVTYPADTKMYIQNLTQPTEDDLVANQAITSGQYFMIGNSLYLALANIASGAQITIGTNAQRVSLADALNTINS